MGTSTSTCNLQEKDNTQIEDRSSLDSSNRLALKRRYVSTDSGNNKLTMNFILSKFIYIIVSENRQPFQL
jgi:hypothetical protein